MKKNIVQILVFGFLLLGFSCSKSEVSTTTTAQGKSGSLARMVVVGNYLYVIDHKDLSTFDISQADNPIEKNKQTVGFGIETIFPFANYLFLGSNDGMYIYDISNPAMPKSASAKRVEHITACDPVVANENYAYVTLNSLRNNCGNQVANRLLVVDVQDVLYPKIVYRKTLSGPKGLGLSNTHLFICEKDEGVVVFDLSQPALPTPVDTLSGFTANDIIMNNGTMVVVCEDGIRQFNYNNIDSIYQISHLAL